MNLEKQNRTKKAIKDAFMELYRTLNIDKISIRMICEKAKITRSTFYTYYEGIYELLESIEEELWDGLGPYFENYTSHVFDGAEENPYASTVQWFEYCKANRDYLVILLGPNGDPRFEYMLRKRLKKDVNKMMDADGMNNDYLRKYVVEYMVGANIALTRFWLESEDDLSAEEVALIANLLREGRIALKKRK